MAFSCGRNDARVMSFEVWTGRPTFAAASRNRTSFVPIAAVCTGSVCSTHSE